MVYFPYLLPASISLYLLDLLLTKDYKELLLRNTESHIIS